MSQLKTKTAALAENCLEEAQMIRSPENLDIPGPAISPNSKPNKEDEDWGKEMAAYLAGDAGPILERICGSGLLDAAVAMGAKHVPSYVDRSDFNVNAIEGALQALERFDPAMGKGVDKWVFGRMVGAVLDALRELDPLGRSERWLQKTSERLWERMERNAEASLNYNQFVDALEHSLSKKSLAMQLSFDEHEAAVRITLDPDRYESVVKCTRRIVSKDEFLPSTNGTKSRFEDRLAATDGLAENEFTKSPDEALEHEDLIRFLQERSEIIPNRNVREVMLAAHDTAETSDAEIAARLDVCESRVSQLRSEGYEWGRLLTLYHPDFKEDASTQAELSTRIPDEQRQEYEADMRDAILRNPNLAAAAKKSRAANALRREMRSRGWRVADNSPIAKHLLAIGATSSAQRIAILLKSSGGRFSRLNLAQRKFIERHQAEAKFKDRKGLNRNAVRRFALRHPTRSITQLWGLMRAEGYAGSSKRVKAKLEQIGMSSEAERVAKLQVWAKRNKTDISAGRIKLNYEQREVLAGRNPKRGAKPTRKKM